VHWLELLDAIDREDEFQADVIQMVNGEPRMRARPRTTPLESLQPDIVRMHEVGVVRALSGALDCAAGTTIGVVALPLNILKADFLGVLRYFERRPAPATEGENYQYEFGRQLTQIIDRAGPAGWLDWVLNFRNMLVQRPANRDRTVRAAPADSPGRRGPPYYPRQGDHALAAGA
jgi:hypothetical protein